MTRNAEVSIIVKIDGVTEKTFTAAGGTDGDVHRLARRLSQTVAGDVQVWSVDRGFEAECLESSR